MGASTWDIKVTFTPPITFNDKIQIHQCIMIYDGGNDNLLAVYES